jgi:pimeloyl-ACP methyl ester carboxylesterase
MNRTGRTLAAAGAGAAAAGAAALAARPAFRREVRRAGRFARPLGRGVAGAPVPPCLPPGRVINLPGRGEIFFRDSGGPGAAVLLLHGWTASADLNFFPAYAPLGQAYRVIAPDLRGHGRGMRTTGPFSLADCADDAAALLGQLGVRQTVAVGYSMGGPVAMLLARRHPGPVAALVMQATALEWHRNIRERMVWRLLPAVTLGLRLGAGPGFVDRVLRQVIEEQPALDAYRPWLAAEFRRGLCGQLAAAGRALSRYDAEPWAGQLAVPAAVLITTGDRLVCPAKQRAMAAALRAETIEVAADHDLPLVRGTEYARLTRLLVDMAAAAAGLGSAGSAGSAWSAGSRLAASPEPDA